MNVFRVARLAPFLAAVFISSMLAGAKTQPDTLTSSPGHDVGGADRPAQPGARRTLDGADLNAFFDGLVPMRLVGTRFFAYDAPYMQYEHMPLYEDSTFVFAAIKLCLGVMALVMRAPMLRLVQRVCFGKRPLPQAGTLWLPWHTQLLAGIWSIFSVVIGFVYLRLDLTLMRSNWESAFWLVNAVTALALVLSIVAVVSSLRIWRRVELCKITKLKFSLVALSCLVPELVCSPLSLLWVGHQVLIGSASVRRL